MRIGQDYETISIFLLDTFYISNDIFLKHPVHPSLFTKEIKVNNGIFSNSSQRLLS